MKWHLLRRILQFTLILFIFSISTPPAFAHTELVNASPAPGSSSDLLPKNVELVFNEKLLVLADRETGSISITSATGDRVDNGQFLIRDRTLSVGLINTAASGSFSVSWRAVAEDGHPVEGNFTFKIASNASASPTQEAPSVAAKVGTPVTTTNGAKESNSGNKSSLIEIVLLGLLSAAIALILLRRRNRSR